MSSEPLNSVGNKRASLNRSEFNMVAEPSALCAGMPLREAAAFVLDDAFGQFLASLNLLRTSDDAEVVHQARVGWRRFSSACRLFRPVPEVRAVPSRTALKPILALLGELRDLDVTRAETLPKLAQGFVAGDARRAHVWKNLTQGLARAARGKRQAVRRALKEPAVSATLFSMSQWIQTLHTRQNTVDKHGKPETSLRPWARHRISRLHDRLKQARKCGDSPENEHRVRILAKRLRYGIEALDGVLNTKQARAWHLQASRLQRGIGARRDLLMAGTLATNLNADPALLNYLRGVAINP